MQLLSKEKFRKTTPSKKTTTSNLFSETTLDVEDPSIPSFQNRVQMDKKKKISL